jgi:hypothetical protein
VILDVVLVILDVVLRLYILLGINGAIVQICRFFSFKHRDRFFKVRMKKKMC